MNRLDWKGVGQYNAVLVKLATIIVAAFKEAKVDLDILGWLCAGGTAALWRACGDLATAYKASPDYRTAPPPLQLNPFNRKEFCAKGVSIWRGPVDRCGLKGEEAQDGRSLLLKELDAETLTGTNFRTFIWPSQTASEVELRRLKEEGVQADARFAVALYKENGQKTLRFIHDTFGVTWIIFYGTILRDANGDPCVPYLRRRTDGGWFWGYYWLNADCRSGNHSLCFPIPG